ncbi:MAG: family 1 glycosylhydrolase [Chthoniobacterales bacterium]
MTDTKSSKRLQVWGGVEPTINRIGDGFSRQFDRNGHRERLSDLNEFARIGLRTLRFPILWEEVAPNAPDDFHWTKIDAAVQRLEDLGIRPIAGLLHHGSGPRHTSLVDPQFPQKLAAFARAVAERYPSIDAYTPVNEPLTTARFSGMYGLWYPHGRDEATFARCLMNQCWGTVLAMRAIREVNPRAQLVQTDDLGKTYSTPQLQYQADFENDRRWVTWDLLTGKLGPDTTMWSALRAAGIAESELAAFQKTPCPPDIVGINHYITSERLLDGNVAAHPPETHGGNGRGDRYADVAAVRSRAEEILGAEGVLREAWGRYGLPLAVTEAHLGCTREEQLRWFMEVWRGAGKLRGEGVDIHAVTVWSLLGAFDWNSLLTREDGSYESGAYDLRGGKLRPTAIAHMIEELAHGRDFDHPTLQTNGWWRRRVRLLHAAVSPAVELPEPLTLANRLVGAPIMITGATGRVAQGFIRAAELRGLPYHLFSHRDLDITDEAAVAHAVDSVLPWAVINCAGFSRVDDAELDEESCRRANVDGAVTLASICARSSTPLVTFSSDHVFNGDKGEPYVETDEPHPVNVYGESKVVAEGRVLSAFAKALIIRPGKMFAPFEDYDFLRHSLRAIARGESVRAENDVLLSGTYLPDLVHATLDLLVDGETGVWHLANSGAVTPEQFLIAAADVAQLDARRVEGVPLWKLDRPAPRAQYRALGSERGQLLPPLHDAIERYCRESPLALDGPVVLAATS